MKALAVSLVAGAALCGVTPRRHRRCLRAILRPRRAISRSARACGTCATITATGHAARAITAMEPAATALPQAPPAPLATPKAAARPARLNLGKRLRLRRDRYRAWLIAGPGTYAAPFCLTGRCLVRLAASRASRSARKRVVFSRIACSWAWYSAIACWASRNCCSFLNSASARRCASSVFMRNIGTPLVTPSADRSLSTWPCDQTEVVAGAFFRGRQVRLRLM
jgi:hypothetical protein